MTVKVEWNDAKFQAAVRAAVNAGLDAAAITVQNQIQRNLSRAGAPRQAILDRGRRALANASGLARSKLSGYIRGLKREAKIGFKAALVERNAGLVDPPGGFPRLRTGTLRRSIRFETPREFARRIGPGAEVPYAAIHEFGGIIRAKSKPMLRFVIDGKFVQVKQVRIPARPYVRPAFHAVKGKIPSVFAGEAARIMRAKGY